MHNKKPSEEGLTGQFLEVEQALSVSQNEAFAPTVKDQCVPIKIDVDNDFV
jgi:hypothetical protein